MDKLKKLYDELSIEGCNRFYISGIGGPIPDGVDKLEMNGNNWEIYYTERGQKEKLDFSTTNIDEAITYYREHILHLEHWHLIVFTRSFEIFDSYKKSLEKQNIRTIQNDIPCYNTINDRIYRLFVVNKDIFKARKLFENIPYFDENLR